MMRIILSGASGKMGNAVASSVSPQKNQIIVAGIDKNIAAGRDFPMFHEPSLCDVPADVVIDFSHPDSMNALLDYCISNKLPLVSGTTGLKPEVFEKIQEVAKRIPVFYATNMSWGVFVLNKLVALAAKELYSEFDIEIIERHHNQKIDAPSGTALTLLKTVQSVIPETKPIYDRHNISAKREHREIGMHTVRGGSIVGTHEVIFAGTSEIVEIKHIADSKNIFALGAIKAAEFLVNQKAGLYDMNSLIQ